MMRAARGAVRRVRAHKERLAMRRRAAALPEMKRPVLLLGHEMKKSGASMLFVHLANEYARSGYDVVLLINAGSPMAQDAVACLDRGISLFQLFANTPECHELLALLVKRGCRHCIANTVVTGLFAQDLQLFGLQTTWLIHEMTCSCRILRAEALMESIRQTAHAIVFPAQTVLESFRDMCAGEFICPTPIVPQGIYKALPEPARTRDQIRAGLARDMGIPEDAVLLTGAGAVNFGKGCDLLVPALTYLREEGKDGGRHHVLWLGNAAADDPYVIWLCGQIKSAGLDEYWHWAGFIADDQAYAEYLFASDIFVLPSREDSYPSVMLEAQRLGVPTLAFDKSGGGADLSRSQHGHAAKPSDIQDFCRLIGWMESCSPVLTEQIVQCAERLHREAGFRRYAEDIADIANVKR